MKKQKTFDADTEAGVIESWVSEYLFDNNMTIIKPRDPAEWQYLLTNKVTVVLQIHDDDGK